MKSEIGGTMQAKSISNVQGTDESFFKSSPGVKKPHRVSLNKNTAGILNKHASITQKAMFMEREKRKHCQSQLGSKSTMKTLQPSSASQTISAQTTSKRASEQQSWTNSHIHEKLAKNERSKMQSSNQSSVKLELQMMNDKAQHTMRTISNPSASAYTTKTGSKNNSQTINPVR